MRPVRCGHGHDVCDEMGFAAVMLEVATHFGIRSPNLWAHRQRQSKPEVVRAPVRQTQRRPVDALLSILADVPGYVLQERASLYGEVFAHGSFADVSRHQEIVD